MVLESADDQWRIPVTFGNFDNSCAVAGALSGWPASEASSGLGFSVAVGVGLVGAGAAVSFADESAGLTGIFSV